MCHLYIAMLKLTCEFFISFQNAFELAFFIWVTVRMHVLIISSFQLEPNLKDDLDLVKQSVLLLD